jgi:hypothetical protein
MIVAMVAVGVVKVAVDQIVDMVAMRDWVVTTAWTMLVALRMAAAIMVRRATIGIGSTHSDRVLVEVILVRVMQVAVVEIVHVTLVPHCCVAAAWAMLVRMIVMDVVRCHSRLSFQNFSLASATAFSMSAST